MIVSSFRTPQTKTRRQGLKDTYPEIMLEQLFKHTFKHVKMDPKLVDDVVIGNVL